jgi:hypothetical protein
MPCDLPQTDAMTLTQCVGHVEPSVLKQFAGIFKNEHMHTLQRYALHTHSPVLLAWKWESFRTRAQRSVKHPWRSHNM